MRPGSLSKLWPALALACVALALPARTTAGAGDTAPNVATRFATAFINSDGATACALVTPTRLAIVGGLDSCTKALSRSATSADIDVYDALSEAYDAARLGAGRRRGDFVRKGFGVKSLAREIERAAPDVTVKVARGPNGARGQLPTTVILDPRTSARRLVLYGESDSGTIFRLVGSAFADPKITAAAKGIPETTPTPGPEFVVAVDSVNVSSTGKTYVNVTIGLANAAPGSGTLQMVVVVVPDAGGYLVDDALFSVLGTELLSVGP